MFSQQPIESKSDNHIDDAEFNAILAAIISSPKDFLLNLNSTKKFTEEQGLLLIQTLDACHITTCEVYFPGQSKESNMSVPGLTLHLNNLTAFKWFEEKYPGFFKEYASITMLAVQTKGALAITKYLFENKNVSITKIKDSQNATLLHYAAGRGDVETTEYLLSLGADTAALTNEDKTPLFLACFHNNPEVAYHLVRKSSLKTILKADKNNKTSALSWAAYNGMINVIKFVRLIPNMVLPVTDDGHTVLHTATTGGQLELVKYLLTSRASKLEETTNKGKTAIFLAINKKQLKIVEYLLEQNCSVKARGPGGATPLLHAIALNQPETADLLLKYGASFNEHDNDGKNAVVYAAIYGAILSLRYLLSKAPKLFDQTDNDGTPPLLYAAQEGRVESMQFLLESKLANLNDTNKNWGGNALFCATRENQISAIEWLISQSIPINHKSHVGHTALLLAAEKGYLEAMQILKKHGALLDGQSNDGVTALMLAANRKHLKCVTYLIEQGVDIHAVDNKGKNALIAALEGHAIDIVELLFNHGAATSITSKMEKKHNVISKIKELYSNKRTQWAKIVTEILKNENTKEPNKTLPEKIIQSHYAKCDAFFETVAAEIKLEMQTAPMGQNDYYHFILPSHTQTLRISKEKCLLVLKKENHPLSKEGAIKLFNTLTREELLFSQKMASERKLDEIINCLRVLNNKNSNVNQQISKLQIVLKEKEAYIRNLLKTMQDSKEKTRIEKEYKSLQNSTIKDSSKCIIQIEAAVLKVNHFNTELEKFSKKINSSFNKEPLDDVAYQAFLNELQTTINNIKELEDKMREHSSSLDSSLTRTNACQKEVDRFLGHYNLGFLTNESKDEKPSEEVQKLQELFIDIQERQDHIDIIQGRQEDQVDEVEQVFLATQVLPAITPPIEDEKKPANTISVVFKGNVDEQIKNTEVKEATNKIYSSKKLVKDELNKLTTRIDPVKQKSFDTLNTSFKKKLGNMQMKEVDYRAGSYFLLRTLAVYIERILSVDNKIFPRDKALNLRLAIWHSKNINALNNPNQNDYELIVNMNIAISSYIQNAGTNPLLLDSSKISAGFLKKQINNTLFSELLDFNIDTEEFKTDELQQTVDNLNAQSTVLQLATFLENPKDAEKFRLEAGKYIVGRSEKLKTYLPKKKTGTEEKDESLVLIANESRHGDRVLNRNTIFATDNQTQFPPISSQLPATPNINQI